MPGTRDNLEDLRDRIQEVEDLWSEEEQKSLAKVSHNADDCERHPGKVRKSVPDEHPRRVPAKQYCLLPSVAEKQHFKLKIKD